MKNRKILFLAFLALNIVMYSNKIAAQIDCSGGRYTTEVFPQITITSDILYGTNVNHSNVATDLFVDVYEPSGDTIAERPLIVFAHGGFFLAGDRKNDDAKLICEAFAKRGFVAASISYRLGVAGLPDTVKLGEALFRAVQDEKAAVRFFRKNYAEQGNTYKIDTNHIYIGGSSAGGFASMHLAYMNELTELPAYIDTTNPGMGGGLEGLSGNAGYSSVVHGVLNACGALGQVDWIKPNDVPLSSIHGTADATVPIDYGKVKSGFITLNTVYGSRAIHQYMNAIGAPQCLAVFEGADHVPYCCGAPNAALYLDSTMQHFSKFFDELLCGNAQQNCYAFANTSTNSELEKALSQLYYNSGVFTWVDPKPAFELRLYDLQGRELVLRKTSLNTWQTNPLKSGIYLLKGQSPTSSETFEQKFLITGY